MPPKKASAAPNGNARGRHVAGDAHSDGINHVGRIGREVDSRGRSRGRTLGCVRIKRHEDRHDDEKRGYG